ncbi:LysR family transcriptional regulator [Psychromonas sp.]|nr:LysR family transcriptional regulator [Psychromonas sp.]
MNLDLNQLRILIALDDERNISKAAKKLYVTQSAASHNLAKLRERFNDPLFLRTSKGMEPTPFAKSMIPILRQGISDINRAADMQSTFNPLTDAHTFYVGACDYFEFVAMPLLAEKFAVAAPNIRLSIDINSEHVKMEEMENGSLDFHVGVDNMHPGSKSINRQKWISDQYVAVVAKWRDIPDKLTIMQFAGESQIHLPVTANASDVIDSWLLRQKLYRNIQMVTQSYAIGGMISARTGLLFPVPLKVANLLTSMLPLKIISLPDDVPPLVLSIMSHSLYEHQESIQWLLSEIFAIKEKM